MVSTISTWILSIAGVIILSVLMELILPDGQMNKYIKTIFSFVIILTIIMPIPKLLGQEIKNFSFFPTSEIELQEEFIYQNNIDKLTAIENQIKKEIEASGYENVVVSINADIFKTNMTIEGIYVDIQNIIINKNNSHKDISQIKVEIVSIIRSNISIKEENIVFNE